MSNNRGESGTGGAEGSQAGEAPPSDDVTELIEMWEGMVNELNEASIKAIKLSRSSWLHMTDEQRKYEASDVLRDSAQSYAIGVNALRGLAGHWWSYSRPEEKKSEGE